jgi:hypothetical protein
MTHSLSGHRAACCADHAEELSSHLRRALRGPGPFLLDVIFPSIA